jgi:hypothetical protein
MSGHHRSERRRVKAQADHRKARDESAVFTFAGGESFPGSVHGSHFARIVAPFVKNILPA